MPQQSPKNNTDYAAWGTIIIGLLIGYSLKGVKFGMLFGIVFALAALLFYRKKMRQ